MEPLHCSGVGDCPLFVVRFCRIIVKDGKRLNEVALALGLCLDHFCFSKQLLSPLPVSFCWTVPELVIETHGLSPVSDSASRVLFSNLLELLAGLFICKGVEQSHTALERLLYCAVTGNGKRNRTQLLIGINVMMLIVESGPESKLSQQQNRAQCERYHGGAQPLPKLNVRSWKVSTQISLIAISVEAFLPMTR